MPPRGNALLNQCVSTKRPYFVWSLNTLRVCQDPLFGQVKEQIALLLSLGHGKNPYLGTKNPSRISLLHVLVLCYWNVWYTGPMGILSHYIVGVPMAGNVWEVYPKLTVNPKISATMIVKVKNNIPINHNTKVLISCSSIALPMKIHAKPTRISRNITPPPTLVVWICFTNFSLSVWQLFKICDVESNWPERLL